MPSPKIGEEPIKDKKKKKKKNIFKRKKDDMGNKGRKGKGPKPMDVNKESKIKRAPIEPTNTKTIRPISAPVIQHINTDLSSKAKFALENQSKLNAQRFQGSTKPLGNIKPIQSMLTNKIKKGLSAASTFKPSKRDMELKEAHLGTPKNKASIFDFDETKLK